MSSNRQTAPSTPVKLIAIRTSLLSLVRLLDQAPGRSANHGFELLSGIEPSPCCGFGEWWLQKQTMFFVFPSLGLMGSGG